MKVVRVEFNSGKRATKPVYGGVDAGGTKFLCAVGNSKEDILEVVSVPTASQQDTLDQVVNFFRRFPMRKIGVCSFGPLIRDPTDPLYGQLRNSPKMGWENANILGYLQQNLSAPIVIDTDVNGAALAEREWGVGKGCSSLAYVTVGTGIGIGVISGGNLVTGVSHMELGHYRPPRHCDDPPWSFAGFCRFHKDCLEGLISGPAIEDRFGASPETLSDDSPIWPIVADYLAHLCTLVILGYAPERIIFGGGVMKRDLIGMIVDATRRKLGGYLTHPLHAEQLNNVIVKATSLARKAGGPPINAGVLGGLFLAGAPEL